MAVSGSGDIDKPCLFVVPRLGKEGNEGEGKVGPVTGGKVCNTARVLLSDDVVQFLLHGRLPFQVRVMEGLIAMIPLGPGQVM